MGFPSGPATSNSGRDPEGMESPPRKRRSATQDAASPKRTRTARTVPYFLRRGQKFIDQPLHFVASRITDQEPSVDEERGRPAYPERIGLCDVPFDLGEGGAAVVAQPEPGQVESRGLGQVHYFGAQVVGGDPGLLSEDPFPDLPERLRILPPSASAGDRCLQGPGMDVGEGQVLQHQPHLAGIYFQQPVLAKVLVDLLAGSALQVGEFDDCDRGSWVPADGRAIGADQLPPGRVHVHVRLKNTAEDVISAVFGYEDLVALDILAGLEFQGGLVEVGKRGFGQVLYLNRPLGGDGQGLADALADFPFIQRGRLGRHGPGSGQPYQRECYKEKPGHFPSIISYLLGTGPPPARSPEARLIEEDRRRLGDVEAGHVLHGGAGGKAGGQFLKDRVDASVFVPEHDGPGGAEFQI